MKWARFNKLWFQLALLILIITPILMLAVLDYGNIEGYKYRYNGEDGSFEPWSNTYFDQNFTFDLTWKGRMFYSIFAWFLVVETALSWRTVVDNKPANRKLMVASLACALIPTVFVLAVNFFGLDLTILKEGLNLGLPAINAQNEPSDFLHLQWPLSIEYTVFFFCFLAAILLAYKIKGLKTFSISLAVLGAMAVAYMLDTIYPFGVFRPLQEMTLPTAATTAALFDVLGYTVQLNYPYHLGESMLPQLTVGLGSNTTSVAIAWACAGVYSLLLYVLIILLFFKRSSITAFRKAMYFFIGLFGTFMANVLRIYIIIIIRLNDGVDAGMVFHNTYGELFGFSFIFGFILVIVCIERFSLIERTLVGVNWVGSSLKREKPTPSQQEMEAD
ncbi:MAG: archaeosortase/exosortase family protein [Candidatus Bathyarchaeota archaeon]|nr:archaeosortase/exosortase family protein [Candidatus Bathyarchaeota archaeon]